MCVYVCPCMCMDVKVEAKIILERCSFFSVSL